MIPASRRSGSQPLLAISQGHCFPHGKCFGPICLGAAVRLQSALPFSLAAKKVGPYLYPKNHQSASQCHLAVLWVS